MKFLVLGAGAQGCAAAFDLCRNAPGASVVLADLDPEPLPRFLEEERNGDLELVKLDARDGPSVDRAMEGADCVLCALPFHLNFPAAERAVEAGAHYCDLGGNSEIVERQRGLDGRARAVGVSVIPDCGLAPGLVNVLAQAGIEALDRADSVRVRVGGLPRDPRPPLDYQIVYSIEGVLDYYTTDALVLEDGEPVHREALTGVESVDFPEPIGTLEAFYTGGGISSLPLRHRGRIRHMEYKTLRYPGHARLMKAIRDLGLLDDAPIEVDGCDVVPRRLFVEKVGPRLLDPEGRDVVVARVEVHGEADGGPRTIRWDLLDRYDEEEGMTAMMRTTGFSLATTALMQADGRIEEVGVHTPDECVPVEVFLRELGLRGIRIGRVDL